MRRSSSPTKISGELDIPQQTISSFLQRFNERGSIDNVKPPGLQGHEKLLHERTITLYTVLSPKPIYPSKSYAIKLTVTSLNKLFDGDSAKPVSGNGKQSRDCY